MESRKKEPPRRITIEQAEGDSHGRKGGHIVEHSYDNSLSGPSYRPPEKHVFTSHSALMAHLHEVTGGPKATAPKDSENDGGATTGTGKPKASATPPKPAATHGAKVAAPKATARGGGMD